MPHEQYAVRSQTAARLPCEGRCSSKERVAASSHLIRRERRLKGRGRRSTHSVPAQTSPSLAHDPGLRLAIGFRPKDMPRSHQRRKLLKFWFPSAYASASLASAVSHQFPRLK